jgi:hypothetical protein
MGRSHAFKYIGLCTTLQFCTRKLTCAQDKERLKLFRAACARHLCYGGWAVEGQGVDRHLLGLKMLLQKGEDLPVLYTDPAFGLSSHWTLSTSQLSTASLESWGYGAGASRPNAYFPLLDTNIKASSHGP